MMRYAGAGLIALFAAGVAPGALAQGMGMEEAARRFGARPYVEQASLSPDGMAAAILQPTAGQGAALYIIDLSREGELQPVRIIGSAPGQQERISGCSWASNGRLLCDIFIVTQLNNGEIAYVTRILAVDRDGGDVKLINLSQRNGEALGYGLFGGNVIDWAPGTEGHVLMMRQYVPEQTTGTHIAQTKDGVGVDDVDTVTLGIRSIEKPRPDAREYISDGKGAVRIIGLRATDSAGYDKVQLRYLYRPKTGGNWQSLSTVDGSGSNFDPHRVDPVLDIAYGLKDKDGRAAAYKKALDGSGTETLLYAHPQVDVDGFLTIGRNRRTIGVTYATDKREAFYFDPDMAKLVMALSKALPNLPLVRIVDSSEDEKKLLIWAGSDTDPGRYYLLDRTTSRMEQLLASRPQLEEVPLAKVQVVSYPAADGTMIPAYLTMPPSGAAKGLPAIVMPHGGPGARDEWGFDWLAQYFANQGYAVLQPNFRGSTGYGDGWFQKNGFQNWGMAIGDVDDGGRWLVKQGIAQADKLAIVGWSYGGYAALQSAVTEPGLFKAVIAIAPVTDLERLREERAQWSDYSRVSSYIGTGSHIEAGSPARHASAIKAPVLMFHGMMDRNVGVRQSRLMDERLRKAGGSSELITYDNLDHYLEDAAARADMLSRSAAFLAKALKL